MTADIKYFIEYLENEKKASKNTVISYQRDLVQLAAYLEAKGVTEAEKMTKTSLNRTYCIWRRRGKPPPRFRGSWLPLRHFSTMNCGREESAAIRRSLSRLPRWRKRRR